MGTLYSRTARWDVFGSEGSSEHLGGDALREAIGKIPIKIILNSSWAVC